MTAKAPPKHAEIVWAKRSPKPAATAPTTAFAAGEYSKLKSFNMDVALMAAVEAKLARLKAEAFVPPRGPVQVSKEVQAKLNAATSKAARQRIILAEHFGVDPSRRPMTFTSLVHELLTEWVSRP